MRDDDPADELTTIADSAAPLHERARRVLTCIDSLGSFDAAWLAVSDPRFDSYALVGSSGLDRMTTDVLNRPEAAEEVLSAVVTGDRPVARVAEFAGAVVDSPVWAGCLGPAGFRQGLGMVLCEPGGSQVGFLGLLYSNGDPPSEAARNRLELLAPLIARGLSPVRTLLLCARLVPSADSGVVLLRDGTTCSLPGFQGHDLLSSGSPVVHIANDSLTSGQVSQSFLWPRPGTVGEGHHVRLTVLAATDVPHSVAGVLLLTSDADCRGLTPRELQVLGLLVDGRSNQEVSRRLDVAPRTVATHVEHVMRKLDAPSRTLAAVRAEREGCYVPPLP